MEDLDRRFEELKKKCSETDKKISEIDKKISEIDKIYEALAENDIMSSVLESIKEFVNSMMKIDWTKICNAEIARRVEKGIPRAVIYEGDGFADGSMIYDMARCPSCDRLIEKDDTDWQEPYCCGCGQKLDWTIKE